MRSHLPTHLLHERAIFHRKKEFNSEAELDEYVGDNEIKPDFIGVKFGTKFALYVLVPSATHTTDERCKVLFDYRN
jgi:hypothetical protein